MRVTPQTADSIAKQIIKEKLSETRIYKLMDKYHRPDYASLWKIFGYENVFAVWEKLLIQEAKTKYAPTDLIRQEVTDSINFAWENLRGTIENVRLLDQLLKCIDIFPYWQPAIRNTAQLYKATYQDVLLGLRLPVSMTETEFCDELFKMAQNGLANSEYADFLKESTISEIREAKSHLSRVSAKHLIKAQERYSRLVRDFIQDQINYAASLIEDRSTPEMPTTLDAKLTRDQLATVCKNMIKVKLIKPIKENDFIYLFTKQPIITKMPKIIPLPRFSKSMNFYFLKSLLGIGIETMDYATIRLCFKRDNPLDRKDNTKKQYKEIDDLLLPLHKG